MGTVSLKKSRRNEGVIPAWVIGIALFVFTLAIFAPAIRNGFVNYDDNVYVTENPQVKRGLTAQGVRWALTAEVSSNWHPLTLVSHLLDVSLFGLDPRGHHATSILLHALTAMLAFFALRRLTRRLWPSAITAAVFALHPLRVESVAWIAERKDVLSGLFFFSILWFYAVYSERRAVGRRAWPWYLGALISLLLGLTSKPMLVTVPCVLLLVDYWPLRRWPSSSAGWLILEKLPFLLLSAASSWATYAVQSRSGAVTSALTLAQRSENAIVSVMRYVGKILWPADLSVLYPHPGNWDRSIVAGAGLGIVALTGIALAQWRRRPWITMGWFWFVGMLVPVIGLVQVGLQSMADRYTYLPAIGVVVAAVWTLAEVVGGVRPKLGLATSGLLAALALITLAQIRVWRDSITLFTHTIEVAGEGNYLAYDNRGVAWQLAGNTLRAVADYERALAIKSDYPNANNNLGRVLAERGQLDEAIAHYRAALKAQPGMIEVHNNLANALCDAGQIAEAVEHYRYVLQREPNHLDSRNGYAVALAMQGRMAESEAQFKQVLVLDPDNAAALSNLGNVCAIAGRRAEAQRYYARALQRNPDDARTLANFGNMLLEDGQTAAAAERLSRAVMVRPVNPDAHAKLGLALLRLGRRNEAIQELQIALQQRPDFADARTWLEAARQPGSK